MKASILTCANEYIEKLLRQVQELQYDLVYESSFESNFSCCEDDQSSCECDTSLHCTEERAVDSNVSLESICLSNCDCSQPTVCHHRFFDSFGFTLEGGLSRIYLFCRHEC